MFPDGHQACCLSHRLRTSHLQNSLLCNCECEKVHLQVRTYWSIWDTCVCVSCHTLSKVSYLAPNNVSIQNTFPLECLTDHTVKDTKIQGVFLIYHQVILISWDVLLTKLQSIMKGIQTKWMNTSFYNNEHTLPPLSHPHLLEEFLCHDQLQYNEGSER